MPNKCCVAGCRGNYKLGPRVRIFMFPQEEELRKAWLRAIRREDFVPSKHSAVCERHFAEEDIIREKTRVKKAGNVVVSKLSNPRLRPGTIPTKYLHCPDRVPGEAAAREDPDTGQKLPEADAMEAEPLGPVDTCATEEEADRILSMSDLADHIRNEPCSAFWLCIESSERISFLHIAEDEAPWIKYSLVVKTDLTLTFHVVNTAVRKLGSSLYVPSVARSKKEVMGLLRSIEDWDNDLNSSSQSLDKDLCKTICVLLGKLSAKPTEDKARAIQFFSEQLNLLTTKKEQRRYSVDFMVFSCILFTISPHAYKYIRCSGSITLPHPMTIQSICSSLGRSPQPEHQSATFLSYVAKRIPDLDGQQRFITVTVDEVHIEPYSEYKGVTVTDVPLAPTEVANSVYVLMAQSLTCQFKEVVHVVPVQRADAQLLHKLLRDAICGLEKIGFRVACVVSDGNSVNKKAMSHFTSPPTNGIVYPHPFDPARPLFYVIDPVYILKSVRNNWLDQSNDLLCFSFPEFQTEPMRAQRMLYASFATIREAYNVERTEQLRFRYNVSREALYPSSVDRQNTKLALQVFKNSLPRALRSLGVRHDLQFFKETASFIEIMVKWWKIVNVQAPGKGKRDQFQDPVLPSDDDPKVDFLYKFLDWLDDWKSKDLDSGTLTSETHAALQQTTHALVEISSYCFTELKLPYVLLGKIQTDGLEERFGKYRHLAGSQYHVSIRQLYEGEDELRLQDTLPTIAMSCGTDGGGDELWEGFDRREHTCPSFDVVVTGEALSKLEDILPVLVYVTGHAVRSTLKRLKCAKCKAALTINKMITISVAEQHYELIKELDGEGLLFPTMFALNAVAYSYVVVQQLSKQTKFMKAPNQHQLLTDLTVELLTSERSSDFDACEDGHTGELVLKHVLWCSTHILLKSFSFSVIDDIAIVDNETATALAKARPRKRKRKSK